MSSRELRRPHVPVHAVAIFATVLGEVMVPFSSLFLYFKANKYMFVSTIIDLVPYLIWFWYLYCHSIIPQEFKVYFTGFVAVNLKIVGAVCFMFGDQACKWCSAIGACIAAFAPLLYWIQYKKWRPPVSYVLSLSVRLIATTCDMVAEELNFDGFIFVWNFMKVVRVLTVGLTVVNLVAAVRRIQQSKLCQEENGTGETLINPQEEDRVEGQQTTAPFHPQEEDGAQEQQTTAPFHPRGEDRVEEQQQQPSVPLHLDVLQYYTDPYLYAGPHRRITPTNSLSGSQFLGVTYASGDDLV